MDISIKKYISIVLLIVQIYTLFVGQLYSTEYLHSLDELPSSHMESYMEIASSSLVQEKNNLFMENTETLFPFLSQESALAENFIIERREIIEKKVENITITSKLLEDTLVRNAKYAGVSSENLTIQSASADTLSLAKRKVAESNQTDTIAFEFGIPGTHLIFSKPVLLSLDVPGVSEGTPIDIHVHHAGDLDFNTS